MTDAVAFDRVRVLAGHRELLRVPHLELTEQRVSVIGPNGGGKSTLLQLVNGLVDPSEGYVTVEGKDTVDDGALVRRRAGFVFANPPAQLVMPTPLEDVELSLRRSVKGRRDRREQALRCLDELGITELAERSSHEISAGQQQLVALATVLVLRPRILLLDEPTTLLDRVNARRFTAMVDRMRAAHGIRVITATHDLDLAAQAERCLLVQDGEITADGEPAEIVAEYIRRTEE
ncbi:energy-coupling factor ABC transporter ATP-binding protein [Nesterenkonia populi]|uniref:energy-coupling factor ABC transporter ATP-binding protein n=1 Tax=Nesterenkonia populi TaxID=1591087 RepID=UPI0011BEBBDC|nr:ABC transporter ATP-binding protein [Nesterenkonia populi]